MQHPLLHDVGVKARAFPGAWRVDLCIYLKSLYMHSIYVETSDHHIYLDKLQPRFSSGYFVVDQPNLLFVSFFKRRFNLLSLA